MAKTVLHHNKLAELANARPNVVFRCTILEEWMEHPEREHWKSSLGFVLAAAGSAIGLGNIWRFPTLTGQNGGGSFVLMYIAIVLLVGLPLMYVELSMGRAAQRGPVGAFGRLAPHPVWKLLGYLFVLTGIVILSYYGVVAGWTLKYFWIALTEGFSRGGSGPFFESFTSNGPAQIGFFLAFLGLTVGIVFFGIKGGIERMSTVLMPVLFVLLILLIVYALTLPTAADGLRFYLVPDVDHVTGKTFVFALGQAFFSLSLGMGAMLTYGSYLSPDSNLVKSGLIVVICDTLIAIMAGLLIFPVLGGAPEKSGPGLVFVVLTDLFATLPAGRFVGALFFLLLTIAALTSTISLMEVAASYLIDERGWSRRKSVMVMGATVLVLGIPSALSLGAVGGLGNLVKIGGNELGFLGLADFLFGNVALTAGGFLLILFTVFAWKRKNFETELYSGSTLAKAPRKVLFFLLAVVAPLCLACILGYMLFTGQTLG
ncbi:MAG: sodium-dependent transporter [Deltaproteobacteria bacterium HGW-Deltaproteobacteria-22]|jgi:NSS family neurotransmitter:Na+ symporter|nr:MAG: sodium-dependent transporter [Deltaproteobacteria bacterium HGW-Deltaproteobacteria-22]